MKYQCLKCLPKIKIYRSRPKLEKHLHSKHNLRSDVQPFIKVIHGKRLSNSLGEKIGSAEVV